MSLTNTDYELIDKYLLGNLQEEEKTLFEQRRNDKAFEKELDWRTDMQTVFKTKGRSALKNRLQRLENNTIAKEQEQESTIIALQAKRWLRIAASLLLLVLCIWWWNTRLLSKNDLYAQHFEPYPNIIAPIVKSDNAPTKFELAFQTYEQKKYTMAVDLLNQLPVTEEVSFYLALSLMAQNKTNEASTRLRQIMDNKEARFFEAAQWYLALAYLREEQVNEAKVLLDLIHNQEKHPFKEKARTVLQLI